MLLKFSEDFEMVNKAIEMHNDILYKKLSTLPEHLKNEFLDYLDIFIKQHTPQEIKIHPKAGCMKGMFAMSDDFNEPLECFNEYMQ